MSKVLERYRAATPESAELHARAQRVLPGGNSRQASFWMPYPLTMTGARGPHLTDVDGNRYIDLTNNYTSLVHGHAYPPIVEAVQRQLVDGTQWSAGSRPQLSLAELMVDRVPSIDMIRFTNSGTEAGLLALLIARVVTGRNKILMARYGYHGSMMEFELGTLNKPGPETYIAEYNNLADFERQIEERGSMLAAVFLEPVQGAGGIKIATKEFLEGVANAARKAGALFILDEVITFRLGLAGYHAVLGVEPDLVMFGKLIGGGFPVGAVGGKREFMKVFDPADMKALHGGTYNGNPITTTAGFVSVSELTADRIETMERLALRLKAGLTAQAKRHGLPVTINQVGSLLNLFFMEEPPLATAMRTDLETIGKFHLACLTNGLFAATRGMFVLSTIMTEAMIDEIVARAGTAMRDVVSEIK